MMTQVENYLYVLGGYDGYECLNTVERIRIEDGNKGKVEMLKSMNIRVKNGSCFYNSKDKNIYVVGGWNEKETEDKIFKYNLKTGETIFESYLPHAVEGHICHVLGNNLFIFGGFDGYGVTDKIIKVNLENMEAEVIKSAKLHYKRENHTSQLIDKDKIVVAGGWNGNSAMQSCEIFQYKEDLQTLIHY